MLPHPSLSFSTLRLTNNNSGGAEHNDPLPLLATHLQARLQRGVRRGMHGPPARHRAGRVGPGRGRRGRGGHERGARDGLGGGALGGD